MTHPEAVEAVAQAIRDFQHIPDAGDGYPAIRMGDDTDLARVAVDALVAAGWAPRWEAELDNDRKWCDIMDSAGERPDGVEFTPAVLDAIRAQERQAVAAEIAAAIEAYPGTRGPAIDDPRDPRRPGLDTARRIARDLGKAAAT